MTYQELLAQIKFKGTIDNVKLKWPFGEITFKGTDLLNAAALADHISEILNKAFAERWVMYYDLRNETVEASCQSLLEISNFLNEKISNLRGRLSSNSNALIQILEEFRSSCRMSAKEISDEYKKVMEANNGEFESESKLRPSDWLPEHIVKLRLATYPFVKALIDFLPDSHLTKEKIIKIWLEGREELPADKKDNASPVWELPSQDTKLFLESDKPKSPFMLKDGLTLTVSILAVLVAFFGVYFTNFWERDNLQTRVIGRSLQIGKLDSIHSTYNLVLQLAFFNDGNRPAIINSVKAMVSKDSLPVSYNVVSDTGTSFPLLLQPHDVKLVNYVVKASELLSLYDNGKITKRLVGENNYETKSTFYMHLEYKTVDSRGRLHGVDGPVNILYSVNKKSGVVGISNPINYKVKQEALDLYEDNIKDL